MQQIGPFCYCVTSDPKIVPSCFEDALKRVGDPGRRKRMLKMTRRSVDEKDDIVNLIDSPTGPCNCF